MISLLDRPRRLCDGIARRELLTLGGLSLLGLSARLATIRIVSRIRGA